MVMIGAYFDDDKAAEAGIQIKQLW
jgi:hypothetical protein